MLSIDKFNLSGRKAVIIGASRGLAKRMAISLAQAGADVIVASRSYSLLQEVADQIKEVGREAYAIEVDICHIEDIRNLANKAVEKFKRVDILINAAGTTVRKPSDQITEDDWNKVIEVNSKGMLFACKIFGKQMITQKSGKIINIASLNSEVALPGRTLYTISKAGVVALTKSLAIEWARYNINVNAISPGYFKTELTAPLFENREWVDRLFQEIPMKRIGIPEDLDGITLLLASSASDYITGQNFFVDGGFLAGEEL